MAEIRNVPVQRLLWYALLVHPYQVTERVQSYFNQSFYSANCATEHKLNNNKQYKGQ